MTGIDLTILRPNAAESGKYVPGVVCPNCWRPITDFCMYGPGIAADGQSTLRGYLGHCTRCGHDMEVLQFAHYGLWPMVRYRIDKQPWVEVGQPSPDDVPLVVTGPGGDYRQGYTPVPAASADAITPALDKMETILYCLTQAVKEIKRHVQHNR